MAVKIEKWIVKHKKTLNMADATVKHGVNKKLQERLGYSEPTIRKALQGITKSKVADKIRLVAIKEFGGRTEKVERIIIHK